MSFPPTYINQHPRHGLPSHLFSYIAPLRAPSPFEISLVLPPERPDTDVRKKYAQFVWNAAILMSDRICCGDIAVKGKRVLELGAGTGLSGLVAVRSGAEKVILSDFDNADMLADLRKNASEALPRHQGVKIEVVGHTWGTDTSKLIAAGPYDLILLSDAVWEPSSHTSLLTTLSSLLSTFPATIIEFSCGFHSGRKIVHEFLSKAEEMGITPLEKEEWREVGMDGKERKWDWGWEWQWEEEESQEERNKWVLEGKMGWEAEGEV